VDAATRRAVRYRAGDACEYCQRTQASSPLIGLQVEHIIARKHGGDDELSNLALACAECNLHKSSNLAGIDPSTGVMTRLFHPRRDVWSDHFLWEDYRLAGTTDVGRTTIAVLNLNAPSRLRVRLARRPGE
jgi:hypothetical protein